MSQEREFLPEAASSGGLVITEADLAKLPREATRGLFLSFCEIGDRNLATRCLRILPLMGAGAAFSGPALDEKCLFAYLKAFPAAEDWRVFLSKADADWNAANASTGAADSRRAAGLVDAGPLLVSAYLAGETEKADLLLSCSGLKLTGKLSFPSGTSLPNASGPFAHRSSANALEAALSRDDESMAARLAAREDWREVAKKLLSLDYSGRQKTYGPERDFCADFLRSEIWAAAPKASSALLAEFPLESIHPLTLRSAMSASPLSLRAVSGRFGEAALERAFSGSRSGRLEVGGLGDFIHSVLETSGEHAAESLLRQALSIPSLAEAVCSPPPGSSAWNISGLVLPLHFSPSARVRGAVREAAGFAPLQSLAKALDKTETSTLSSLLPRLVRFASDSGDPAALREFLDALPRPEAFFRRDSETAPTGFARAIEQSSPEALREILSWARETLGDPRAHSYLREEGWIFEGLNQTNGSRQTLRKKGDALAAAIGTGDPLKAQILLEAFPSLDRSRAKETLKYLKGRDSGALAKSLSAFESILLGQALSLAAPEPASRPKSSRGL